MAHGTEPTLNDIAQSLGLSKSTVSRAISGRGRISLETKELVLNKIRELGYHPNAIARSLAVSRTHNIGLVLPSDANLCLSSFFVECLSGVLALAAVTDYDIMVSMGSDWDIMHLDRLINQRKVDGLILMRSHTSGVMQKRLLESAFPFVTIGSSPVEGTIEIDNNNHEASRELTKHLIGAGQKRILFIGGPTDLVVMRDRADGFIAAHKELGLSCDESALLRDITGQTQLQARLVPLLRKMRPDAILAADDILCRWALGVLKGEGRRIPADIRIASLNDSQYLTDYDPPITAVNINARALGETACRVLIDHIASERVATKSIVAHQIALKASTVSQ